MRIVLGTIIMVCGLCGIAMSAMCDVVLNSSLLVFDGMKFSLGLAMFSAVAFFSGLYNLFSTS